MKSACFAFVLVLFLHLGLPAAASPLVFDRFHAPDEINRAFKALAAANPQATHLSTLAKSYGGRPVLLLEIGPESGKKEKLLPAILVVANMEGTSPLASEAALFLAQSLLEKPTLGMGKTWYILPIGNPDAAERFFQKPLVADERNLRPFNDDMDDQTDEDGPEDLNGDGFITLMRQKDPEGEWLPLAGESRLMKRADWSKGEKGIYRIYTEGIDNDRDGQFNEDPPGGVNVGINFPHLFGFHSRTGGSWAGSESETFPLFQFAYGHPEIAMAIAFGESNFCLIAPRSGRKSETDFTKIKIPERFASYLGADPQKTYTMDEIKEMVKPMVPQGMEVDESMIASFLGLGAVVNPLPADLSFYNFLADQYKEYLKSKKADAKRLESPDAKDGAFELWSYYQLGLPSFSLDFWTLPEPPKEGAKEDALTPEKLEKMSSEEFLALGAERIGEFMKSSGAPANFKPEMVINMVKGGQLTPKRMAEMMKQMPRPKAGEEGADAREKALLAYSDRELGGKGFVPWKPFRHPQLGEVEIGGPVPYAATVPPPQKIQELLGVQVPWVFTLAEKLPAIGILKTETEPLGGGLYRLKVWVENRGYLPYPTAMGNRNNRVPPVVVQLQGHDFRIIEGQRRSLVREIAGNRSKPVSWILQAEKPTAVTIQTAAPAAGRDSKTIQLGGKP